MTLSTCALCGLKFDPESADERRRHRLLYGHTPSARPRSE